MKHLIAAIMLLAFAGSAAAQEFSALARIEMGGSEVRDNRDGLSIALRLSQPVPWRAFTLDAPHRLVLDFREVDFAGASRAALDNADNATDIRVGRLRPGWSRMVVDLSGPMRIETAGMQVDAQTGKARITVLTEATSQEEFEKQSGAPRTGGFDTPLMPLTAAPQERPRLARPLVVALDPGHGGLDPGAERDDITEAELMLALARDVDEALTRIGGFRVLLTRQDDEFVPLETRMTRARAAGAQVFVSLHADALEEGEARGASVYALSAEAGDAASQKMAERHERGDLLAGLDFSGHDDSVTRALMDLVRIETRPRSLALARALVAAMERDGLPLHPRPTRQADMAVLRSADFPSVLIEAGFLSDDDDLARLRDPQTRAAIAASIAAGLSQWEKADALEAELVRQ